MKRKHVFSLKKLVLFDLVVLNGNTKKWHMAKKTVDLKC